MRVEEAELTDVELLRGAAAGDREAVRRLVDGPGPVVFGFVFARVGGDRTAADDVVQDTFVEALKSAHTFRGDAVLTTWLCTIARRRIARHFEAERRLVGDADEEALLSVPDPGNDEQTVDDRDEVVRALGRLPVIHRQVLVLKYLDGEPVAGIAAALGRTPVQVQSLLQRARAGLRRELEEIR